MLHNQDPVEFSLWGGECASWKGFDLLLS